MSVTAGYLGEARLAEGRVGDGSRETLRALTDGSSAVTAIPRLVARPVAAADGASTAGVIPRLTASVVVLVDGVADVLVIPEDPISGDVRAGADGASVIVAVPRFVARPTAAAGGTSTVEVLTEREGVHAEGSSTVEVIPSTIAAGGRVEVWGVALVDVRWTGRLRQPARFAQRRAREFGAPRERIGA